MRDQKEMAGFVKLPHSQRKEFLKADQHQSVKQTIMHTLCLKL